MNSIRAELRKTWPQEKLGKYSFPKEAGSKATCSQVLGSLQFSQLFRTHILLSFGHTKATFQGYSRKIFVLKGSNKNYEIRKIDELPQVNFGNFGCWGRGVGTVNPRNGKLKKWFFFITIIISNDWHHQNTCKQ